MADKGAEVPPTDNLYAMNGCFCFTVSLYLDWPDLIGCVSDEEFICIKAQGVGCKLIKDDPNVWMMCSKSECNVGPPKTCCRRKSQAFCIDQRCNLPLSEEVPSMVTCCFFVLLYKGAQKMVCFKKYSEL
mmetsp:Transcript_18083/g.26059  ORF Transcript_18083/g.26059 Transcript_18083/m.26059 type:complete len:130 (+) Transcript_18083:29-418(+)